jgi:hypothetical protein
MKNIYRKFIVFSALIILLGSCYKHDWEKLHPPSTIPPVTCNLPTTVSYSVDILPIFVTSCGAGATNTSCHGPNGLQFNLADYATAQSFSPDTLQNSPNGVQVYQSIVFPGSLPSMPKTGYSISPCDIRMIAKWINQGWPQ